MNKNTGCDSRMPCPPLVSVNVAKHVDEEGFLGRFKEAENTFKIPQVLANLNVEIALETKIHLPTPARALKQIKKNVHVTQCRVIPVTAGPPTFMPKLLISGFVRKDIQYVESGFGNVKDFEIDVPFDTQIRLKDLMPPPAKFSSKESLGNGSQYVEIAPDGMGGNNCVTGGFTNEFFNEPIECELRSAFTRELDFLQDFNKWNQFRMIKEKMDVIIALSLIQVSRVKFDDNAIDKIMPNTP